MDANEHDRPLHRFRGFRGRWPSDAPRAEWLSDTPDSNPPKRSILRELADDPDSGLVEIAPQVWWEPKPLPDLPDVPRCLEPECTGGGVRPADGVHVGFVHMVYACNECAARAGVELAPIPGDPGRGKLS